MTMAITDFMDHAVIFVASANGFVSSWGCYEENKWFFRVQDVTNIAGYIFGTQIGATRMALAGSMLLLEKNPENRRLLYSQFARGALQFFHCTKIQLALDLIRGGVQAYAKMEPETQ